jgi:carbamoyl-phosphate synthase small subunit
VRRFIGNYGVNENEVESDGIKDIRIEYVKNFSFNHSRADSSESLEDYFIKQNLICISDVDTGLL